MQDWERAINTYQSEDPSTATPTHGMKEEKGKTAGDKRGERAARPIKNHWICS